MFIKRYLEIIVISLALFLGLSLPGYSQVVPLPVTILDFSFDGSIENVAASEAGNASISLDADQGDDAADLWTIQATASDNDLDFINDTSTVASISTAGQLTLAANLITTYGRLTPQASPPGSPASGHVYVDSSPSPDELCFYDGAAWQAVISGTDANCQ